MEHSITGCFYLLFYIAHVWGSVCNILGPFSATRSHGAAIMGCFNLGFSSVCRVLKSNRAAGDLLITAGDLILQ